jgi:hypothetical protein
MGRLFEPWVWSGSNLGGPSLLPLQLPWAGILAFVHLLGGDAQLAQRIWYTTLLIGAALGVLGLMRALQMGPLAAVVGAAVYLLNVYVVSVVNINPVYIAALGLLAAMPATVIAVGTGQLSVRWGAALTALAAPMLGYVFQNPPLAGMVLGAVLAAPLVSRWVDGRDAGFRSLRAVSLGIPLLLAASLYWIVPMLIYLPSVASDQLASLSSWNWTETRATISNAFTLDTYWAWVIPAYYPYAPAYDVPPLSLVRFIIPAAAFGALTLGDHSIGGQRLQRCRELRIAVAAASVAIAVIFLSTGTNPPGNVVFNRLYALPLGWLLREPGRFLMLAALCYALLVAVLTEAMLNHLPVRQFLKLRSMGVLRLSFVSVVLGTSILAGFPIYTGAVVPDSRPTLPSAHVRVPAYWNEMAGFVDGLSTPGALLVMPPDDFYQMPYVWGYVGTDDFVVEMFHRRVLAPFPQGYAPASTQLLNAVDMTAQSILNGDWRQVEALTTALNAPFILVRSDIETPYPGRAILSPNDLAAALRSAPNFALVRTIGPLELFSLTTATAESELVSDVMTIKSQAPDLRLLSLLPGVALVSAEAKAGVPNVVQAPALEMWQDNGGGSMVWQPRAPPDWTYRVADLNSRTTISLDHAGTYTYAPSQARVAYVPNAIRNVVTVSVTGRTTLTNGDFASGPWTPVGNCNALHEAQARPYLGANIIAGGAPGGLPALRLSARFDRACESQRLKWNGGPLVLDLMVRTLQGLPPKICLLEIGPQSCAPLPSLPEKRGWSEYRASVTPDPKTQAIELYLYADANGTDTVIEYARVRVVEVPELATFALLANPMGQPLPLQVHLLHNSFSTQWGSTNGEHVLVDGMLNGWLVPSGSHRPDVSYWPAIALRGAQWLSLVTWLIILAMPMWPMIGRVAGHHLGTVAKRLSPLRSRPWFN